ncbi:MAG: SMP-30/gluconolactonase/LRE family protein [Pseudomonadota bacterium]
MSQLEFLAGGYTLIEGPRVDPENNLYFSDVHSGGVYRRRPNGEIDTVIPKRRGVGGIVFHADGGLVVGGRNIQHVNAGEIRVLFGLDVEGGGFNDLHADEAGNIYVGSLLTSPFADSKERTPGDCWKITGEGQAQKLYGGIDLTNGIGFSPDGKTIYHVDTTIRTVVAHDIAGDGTCSNRRAHVVTERGSPDGMTVDEEGGMWVACYGGSCVAHYDANGVIVEYIDIPAKAITSVCFGGEDRMDLYVVTADNTEDSSLGGSIFKTRASVPGLPTPIARV